MDYLGVVNVITRIFIRKRWRRKVRVREDDVMMEVGVRERERMRFKDAVWLAVWMEEGAIT